MNKLIQLMLFSVCLGCASNQSSRNSEIQSIEKKFEKILIGETKDQIAKNFGKPSDVWVEKTEEVWIYNNSDELKTQDLAISFNLKDQTVVAATKIIREKDTKKTLNQVIKEKFPDATFLKVPRLKCQRHAYPLELYYIDSKKGIVIETDRISSQVNSISTTSSVYAAEFTGKLKSCEL